MFEIPFEFSFVVEMYVFISRYRTLKEKVMIGT